MSASCQHGSLRRSCEVCTVEAERDMWKARYEGANEHYRRISRELKGSYGEIDSEMAAEQGISADIALTPGEQDLDNERRRWQRHAEKAVADFEGFKERLLNNNTGGAEVMRRYRLRLGYDDGFDERREPLPDHLCSADLIGARAVVRAAISSAEQEKP